MIEQRAMVTTMKRMELGTVRSVSVVSGYGRMGAPERYAVGFGPMAEPRAGAAVAVAERAEEKSQAAAWFWSVTLAVIVWSLSYLLRQPGVAGSSLVEPFSPVGNFAIEGMVLALAWLGVLVTACLAVLTGAARIEDRSEW